MRKVKYIPVDQVRYINLTIGKIYDVVKYYKDSTSSPFWDEITIIDDSGYRKCYNVTGTNNKPLFIDASQEYRNEVIENILM